MCPKISSVEKYDLQTDEWHKLTPMPNVPTAVQAFNINGKLVCVCTTMPTVPESSQAVDVDELETVVMEFDFVHETWKTWITGDDITQEIVDCFHVCLDKGGTMTFCDIKQKVYVVISDQFCSIDVTDKEGTVLMERVTQLNPVKPGTAGEWTRDRALVVHDRKLYSIGGARVYSKTEVKSCSEVHMYDEDPGIWLPQPDMTQNRALTSAVSLGRYISH